MSIQKDETLEISQVGNGFIVRRAIGRWFTDGEDNRAWLGARDDYLVFRTMTELQLFMADHFTHRAAPKVVDLLPPAGKPDSKIAKKAA